MRHDVVLIVFSAPLIVVGLLALAAFLLSRRRWALGRVLARPNSPAAQRDTGPNAFDNPEGPSALHEAIG